MEYLVRYTNYINEMTELLNALAIEGWLLKQVIHDSSWKYIMIFERELVDVEDDDDLT